nr:LysE family transporter [Psychromonas sp. SP041]
MTYSAFGLTTVIDNSSTSFWTIKILGGGYLIYLGIKGLKAKPINTTETNLTVLNQYSAKKSIGVGFLFNLNFG